MSAARPRSWHSPGACAGEVGELVVGEYGDPRALDRLVDGADVVTYEFENVPVEAAERVGAVPGAAPLEHGQDRLHGVPDRADADAPDDERDRGAPAGGGAAKPKRAKGKKSGGAVSGDAVASPMQGTIVKVAVEEGAEVAEGDVIVVLEAMKMEQPLNAHKSGTVSGLSAEVGATVTAGAVICQIKE